jgi:ribosomal protein S18 acetylase RimI-like enzyme
MRGSGTGPAPGGPDGGVTVRTGRPADAASAARLHATLIADGFLSSLGPRFLRRLYARVARSEDSFLLVAEDEGVPVGFIAGSLALGRLYRSFLLHDGPAAALSAPLRLATALPRVRETLRHGRRAGAPGPSAGDRSAELLAVAVDQRWQGRHVGRRLVEGFLHEVGRRGATSAHVVVGADNTPAVDLYRRAGFVAARTFEMHRGIESLLMEATVGVAPPS